MESTVDFQFLFLLSFNLFQLSLSHCHVYSILKTTHNRIHVFFNVIKFIYIWKIPFLLFLHTLFSFTSYYKIYKIYNNILFFSFFSFFPFCKCSGINFQKIFKYVLNNIINMFCYKYGFCASPLFLKFWYSWCSITKWSKWFKEVRWCCKPKGK